MRFKLSPIKFLFLLFLPIILISCSTTEVIGKASLKNGKAIFISPQKKNKFELGMVYPRNYNGSEVLKDTKKLGYYIPIYRDKNKYVLIHVYKEDNKYVLSFEEDFSDKYPLINTLPKANGFAKRVKSKNANCIKAYPVFAITYEKPYLLLKFTPSNSVCSYDKYVKLKGDIAFITYEKLNPYDFEKNLMYFISDFPIEEQKSIIVKVASIIPFKTYKAQEILYQKLTDIARKYPDSLNDEDKKLIKTIAKKKLPKGIFEKRDEKGRNILHLAVIKYHTDLVSALLKAGADPNVKDFEGKTPLHYAVITARKRFPNTAIIIALLKAGANPNLQDNNGNTPLHYTFAKNFYLEKFKVKNTKVLLSNGANPNIKNKKGETPFTDFLSRLPEDKEKAKRYELTNGNLLNFVYIYIEGNVDLNLTNSSGKYPLDIVLEKEFKAEDFWRSELAKVSDTFIERNAKVSRQNLTLYFLHKGENVYDLAYLFELKNKYPEYADFFDEQINKSIDTLQKLLSKGNISYIRLGNNVSINEKVRIPITTKAYFIVLGEKKVGGFEEFFGKSGWRDYGYIVSHDEEKYPSFDAPIYAGGDATNSLVYDEGTLTAGMYMVKIRTDKSHAYNSWEGHPPDMIDPKNWGLQIVFPNIGKDTLFVVISILNKYPNSKHVSRLKNLLSLAKSRANKEKRDKQLFKSVENKDYFTLVNFIKKHKDNVYRPKAEALAVKKDFEYTFKNISMSKLVLTEGRLLPPSESLGDKISKFFGLPPKDYGNDEVVIRGANVEFRGRNVYVSGIVQNNGNKTVDVNLLGLFRFKTIKKTTVLIIFSSTSYKYAFRWGLFKIPKLKPKEKRAFTFKFVSGKGGGINLGFLGKSAHRTFLEKYYVLPYISTYFYISPKEMEYQKKLLQEVGLYNVDLDKVNVGKLKDVISKNVKGSESFGSSGSFYTVEVSKNASVEVIRDGGGNQVDIVPRDLCSEHNFIAITSNGQKNTNPYDQLDFSYLSFPTTIEVRYKGGCGFFGGSGKDVYIRVKLTKPGAYRIFIYPR